MTRSRGDRGFTLIEVLVALVIVAFGIGALLTALTSAADSVAHLRDKSFAQWIALNRISELRLALGAPAVGKSGGDIEFANVHWRWTQEVTDPGIAGIRRIDVAVSRATAPAAADGQEQRAPAALATAYGFAGLYVAPSSGFDPDWSLESIGIGGTGGTGGGPRGRE
jgi:general secretion pathway protein I